MKSLWEVLGRIMGKSADTDTKKIILQTAESYPEIVSVHDLMLHDYGFGYFVVSMRIEGYRNDSGKLYITAHRTSGSSKTVPALAQPLTWYILPDCKKEKMKSGTA